MVQMFAALFFTMTLLLSVALIAYLLRRDWARVADVLSGRELARSAGQAPAPRVRMRSWRRAETRRFAPQRAAAA